MANTRTRPRRAQSQPPPRPDRTGIWLLTGAVGLALFTVVAFLVYRSEIPKPPPPARPTAADTSASPAPIRAANAIGFVPTTEFGVGQIEGEPASASPKPSSTVLLKVGSEAPRVHSQDPRRGRR